MPRVYISRQHGLRAPRGGVLCPMPEEPTAHEYDRLTGTFNQLPAGPYMGVPRSPDAAQAAGHAGEFGADGDFSGFADVDGPLAVDIEVEVGGDASVERWLDEQFCSSGAVRLLQVTDADEPQVVMMTPHYDAEQRKLGTELDGMYVHAARNCPFATLRLQTVTCADKVTVCSLCSNKGCDQSPADAEFVSNIMQHPVRMNSTVDDLFGTRSILCRCGTAAIKAIWGPRHPHHQGQDAFEEFVEWSTMQEPGASLSAMRWTRGLEKSLGVLLHRILHSVGYTSVRPFTLQSALRVVHLQIHHECAGVQPHMQLLFQHNSYRVVYAPEPRKNYQDWAFLRRIKETNTLLERWECLNCTSALRQLILCLIWIASAATTPLALYCAVCGSVCDKALSASAVHLVNCIDSREWQCLIVYNSDGALVYLLDHKLLDVLQPPCTMLFALCRGQG